MSDKFSKGTGQAMKRGDGMKRPHTAIDVPNQKTLTGNKQTKNK